MFTCLADRSEAALIRDLDGSSPGTYYVDRTSPACSDAGPGTASQPYCTISAAVAARQGPGVTILVAPGAYPEQVRLGASGTPGAPLRLLAAAGGVVVDGADLLSDPAGWVQYLGDVWLAAGVNWSPAQVFADGARLAAASVGPAALPRGSFEWVQGAGLYVNAGGGNPAGHQTRVGHRAFGFVASGTSWVTIDGFTVTRTEDRGIFLSASCANVVLSHNTISFANKMGIQIASGSGFRLQSNVVTDNHDHGIALSGVSGSVLEDNESCRNAQPVLSLANGIYIEACPGDTLRRNRLHDNQDSGLHIQSGSDNCISCLNMSWNNGGHGYDHLGSRGTFHVCDVAYGNRKCGFAVQSLSTGTQIHDCIAANNGLATNSYDLWVAPGSNPGLASDYNLLWNSTSQPPLNYASTTYASLSAYTTLSGQDAQTLQADPRFVDPAAGDFHLLAGSPAIDDADSGVGPWPALDADGRPRADDPETANAGAGPVTYADRGALEFIPPDQAPLVFAPPAITIAEGTPLTVAVHAADPDGQPIDSLAADLSGLPPGGNAAFAVAPGDTTGTLTWTPTYADAGSYTVHFTAANALSGSASTVISVANVDRAPIVTAPAAAAVPEASALSVAVQATDPDGEAIASLTADLSALPAGSNAVFTPGPGNASGTLTWTPTYADSGRYTVTFTAANALSGAASTAITVTDVYHPYEAGTFYVDVANPACSDTGPGTEAQPYCSISAALAAHEGPGTALVVKPGIYRERVEISASGSPDSTLILHAADSGVVIDGADDFSNPARWTPYAGSTWLAAAVDWGPMQVFVDGARLAPSASSPDSLPPGAFTWVLNAGLYVNLGGGNPGGHQVLVGRRKNGFVAYAEEWLTIEGFTVTHMEDRAIFLDDQCDNVNVLHNTVTFGNKYGIQASGGYGFVIGGNITSDNNDHGISLVNGVTESVIEDNESFRNARPAERAANGIYVNASSDNTIRRNRLHDNQDTGLHFQNGANDNVSYLNRSWNNGDHGYDHIGASGTIHICDVAYGNYKDGFSVEGASQSTQIYNSIAVDNGLGTNEFDLWVDLGSTTGFASNYNLFWNSTGQPPVKYITTLYPTVAGYSTASGRDAQTLQADPRFVNPGAGDFHLNAGSPAIDDADSSVPGWPVADAEGNARSDDPMQPNAGVGPVPYADRGALEYRPAALSVAPTSGTAPLAVAASAAGSLGPDGTAVSYRFDFGDGTVVGPQPSPTATHTYAAGHWTATVTVAGQSGGTSAAAASVAVNARPTAALTARPTNGDAPLAVTFDATGSSDPDGTIVSYRFDFGDGTSAGPQTTSTASHTYAPGTWTASVTVTDNAGGTASATAMVTSLNPARHPPVVAAAPSVSVAEASALTMTVHATDPDGEAITALTADLTGLPAGNNAAFSAGPGDSTGVLTWTPTYTDSGSYTVRFVAANDQAGSASTVITVTNVDRAPSLAAPATGNGVDGNLLTVQVTAADPDGDPITTLSADLSNLPAGNDAAFVAGQGDTTGTLTWTPAAGDSGTYVVTFTAANALSRSAATSIRVKVSNQPPRAVLTAAPATGNEPLTVVADASGSSDADGQIVSYRFDFGDGTVVGPQSGATASHAYAAGDFTASVAVTDEDGAAATATAHVVVAAVGSGPNLVANPSFEANTSGWGPYNGAILQRVAGGFDGAWSMKMSGPATTAPFGATDSPNWVDLTPAAGTRYRFTAWVRAATAHGQARLRIREYLDGRRIGSSGYLSNSAWLSPAWQLLLIDYVAQRTGSTLDLQIEDAPAAAGEEFQVDDVSIRIVPATAPTTAAGAIDWKRMTSLGAVAAEDSVLDLNAADPFWRVRVRVTPGPEGSIPRFSRMALRYQDREVAASEMACSEEGACAPLEVLFDREELRMLFAGLPRGEDDPTATLIGEPVEGTAEFGTLAVRVLGAPEPLKPVVSPNPMRAHGGIGFATSRPGPMRAELFDASGRRVRRLATAASCSSGWHEVAVDGRDDGGSMLAAGIYFYRIVSPDGIVTGRLVLLR